MIGTDIIIVAVVFGVGSLACLGWMLWNLISVMRRESLSGQFGKRASQTREVLLKPALAFFVLGGLCSVYFALRGGGVST